MEQPVIIPVAAPPPRTPTLPVGFVPTPSAAYRLHRKTVAQAGQPGLPHLKATPPPPGARVLMWKQDPSVPDIGTRKAFLPGVLMEGPSDARIASGQPGIAPVAPNAFGDFVVPPDTDQFDAVHTFAVVRQTLTMFQRVLAAHDGGPAPWAWNSASDTAPLQVFPHGLPNVMNAYYSRTERALKFGDFVPAGATADAASRVYTCRSFDIVAHETAHAVLDGLKPRWILASAPPQTGGLHESFGDLAAIFLALAQMDQVEAIVAQTRADLHDKTFLADMAEQFGLALGRPNGLRNADNDLALSQTGTEVHAISQVFTGAVYDILADIFAFERRPGLKDDAAVLHRVGGYLCGLTLRALVAAPDRNATYADVANAMLRLAQADGRPADYLGFIRHRFTLREVVVSAAGEAFAAALAPAVVDAPDAMQDRRACCGTMNHPEYRDAADALEQERQALARWCHGYAARGGREPASSEELAAADYGVGQDAS
ncbi:hypothetical protein [Pseudoduganella chitinolytica]|uniref:Peptidase M4 family protein n=1 Tax=Pseudoduganella chitinolytica TaxID=34070 RepID=A0ABY8B4C1_9BURK|nr:hypothetical protein [Pseudoduganella chitinolytica]WEF30796.1 hypothetical protein PX653_15070 [Pseudoduganella chitinolytica]